MVMVNTNLMEVIDRVIVDTLRDCAPDLDISYCFWPDMLIPGPGTRNAAFFLETTFRHPDLPDARTGAYPCLERSWPPSPDQVEECVREGISAIRRMWAGRLHGEDLLPDSGWERDLAAEMGLDDPAPDPSTSSRRNLILLTVQDLILDLLVYSRREDEELPGGEIEEAIAAGEITTAEIVARFAAALAEKVRDPSAGTPGE